MEDGERAGRASQRQNTLNGRDAPSARRDGNAEQGPRANDPSQRSAPAGNSGGGTPHSVRGGKVRRPSRTSKSGRCGLPPTHPRRSAASRPPVHPAADRLPPPPHAGTRPQHWCIQTHSPPRALPPLHSHPKSGLRAPAVDGSVGGCHRRPPPTAANPPPGSSPPPGRRSRRRRDGGAATARTRRRPPTRVAPGGGHAHAAAATPSSTAVRATSAYGGTGACAKWQQRLPEGRAQAEEGERGRQRGGSSSASGERSRV